MKTALYLTLSLAAALAVQLTLCGLAGFSSDGAHCVVSTAVAAVLAVVASRTLNKVEVSGIDRAMLLLGLGVPWLYLLSLASVFTPAAWLVGAPTLAFVAVVAVGAFRTPVTRLRLATAIPAIFALATGLFFVPPATAPGWVVAFADAQDRAIYNGCTDSDVATLAAIMKSSPVDLEHQLRSRPCGHQLVEAAPPDPGADPLEGWTLGEIIYDLLGLSMTR
jgi:hypothetical protein